MKLARRQALVALGALAFARPALARAAPDLALYRAIRDEGLKRGRAMTYATSLTDRIGARLMGSPNMRRAYDWALARLRELGLSDPRLEPIGPFGLSWRQVRAWARMTEPGDAALAAVAAPWSVATEGTVQAEVIAVRLDTDQDLQRAEGRLGGKIVLLGSPKTASTADPAVVRYTDEQVLKGDAAEAVRAYYRTVADRRARQGREGLFKARRNAFLAAEGVAAVVLDGGGGEPGVMTVDGSDLGGRPWLAAERPVFPALYLGHEAYARCWRLAEGGAPPRLALEIVTEEGDPAEPGYNVVAELPGTDPALKSQVVLAGAHLDSWAAGAGAADNGAGVGAILEAVRILRALDLKPRRTIRVVLYGGEEQGLYGSEAYARQRLGHIPRSTAPEQLALSVEGRRAKVGPLVKGPEYEDFSVAFNLDGGSGRIRGVFTGENPALAALYRDWIAPLSDLGVLAVYDGPHWPADQSTFTEIGLPGISFLQDPLDYDSRAHHTNLDTLERLSPDDLAQAATVLAIFLINSANADVRAPRPGL
ncbi:M20/M25/M40 family metallo-hydrolase [Caulobacter sp. RL271]|uniref:Carboxypeptidase Q n=1 Tax=Caulobacter segnis TaxID=88688 RepID=A0ABY5A1G6_9CAUL|nr:M20/M25/M40 family metallo-hydrolase [Caulobacter segnis]USQ98279.1 M20/M25/M40 family metallo-hydrolase [Caulobacter segnis]